MILRLNDSARAFEQWRYVYERDGLMLETGFLARLADACAAECSALLGPEPDGSAQDDQTIAVYMFKGSHDAVVALLEQRGITHRKRPIPIGVPRASGDALEINTATGGASLWASLAQVIVAFISGGRERKVIITMKDTGVVHAEGLSQEVLEAVLQQARHFTAIDPK